jgi:3-dehydroquinate synthase
MLSSINTSTQEVHSRIIYTPDIFNDHWLQYTETAGPIVIDGSKRRLVFVDESLLQFRWKKLINEYFDLVGFEATIVPIHCSEDKKDLESLMFILGEIERFNPLRRSEPIIAFGGGVLMDMVGFAASIFRRGIPYIKVPTTLLGMVDAGLGAKTSINHFGRRNRLGSYFPAIATIIDTQFLRTLDNKEITHALGEIIKIAVIKDERLFDDVESNLDICLRERFTSKTGQFIIKASVDAMTTELTANLWEKDLKRVVDFGHTFSPIPEMKSLTDDSVATLSHGEAVALDVLFSCKLSWGHGLLSADDYYRIEDVIHLSGLPTSHPYFSDPHLLWESLLDATRHRNGNQNVPIPVSIGKSTFLQHIDLNEIKRTINAKVCDQRS